MAPSVLRSLLGVACLAAGASAAALSKVEQRDATDRPRYTPLEDTAPNCIWWWNSDDGLACSLVLMVVGISEEDFISWNPSITPGCGNYVADKSYCIKADTSSPAPTTTTVEDVTTTAPPTSTSTAPGNGVETPSPLQAGVVDNCDEFYYVETGTGCQDVLDENDISLKQFSQWNDVGDDCNSLWAEVYVCVGVIGSDPTDPPPATTTAPDNGITTPTPTQPGMVDDCSEFHFVEEGQGCAVIVSEYDITLSNFAKWNDVGGTSCSGLWANVYVCVDIIGGSTPPPPSTTEEPGNGIPTPSPVRDNMVDNCNDFHLVEDGDGCSSIASDNDIPLNKFYEWNPDAGKDCSSLWRDTYVCVGTTTYEPTPTDPGNGIETPTPIQNGMTENCDEFHFIKRDQNCEAIAKIYGISVAQIIRWNPAAGSQCTGLWANTYACVGVL